MNKPDCFLNIMTSELLMRSSKISKNSGNHLSPSESGGLVVFRLHDLMRPLRYQESYCFREFIYAV